MFFGLFNSKAQATPEQDFWTWFSKNDDALFHFEKNQEKVFDALAAEMKKVDSSLTFEFGPVKNNQREFVISADGIKSSFPAVERLFAAAPKSDHWIFVKFRPRRTPMDIEYSGVKVKASDVFYTIEPDKDNAGITVYIQGLVPDKIKIYSGIAFLTLDQALGEYDMETKVGFVQTKSFSEPSILEKQPIKNIAQNFDVFWKAQSEKAKQPPETKIPPALPGNTSAGK